MIWIAEYFRGNRLFNTITLQAESKVDAEFQAWEGFLHLADCLTVQVFEIKSSKSHSK